MSSSSSSSVMAASTDQSEQNPRGRDPRWLVPIVKLSSALNHGAAIVSATILSLMTLLILVEITLRMFSKSTYMSDVLSGYGVAAITFLSAAWALETGAMIRVNLFTTQMGSTLRWVCEAFVLVCVEIMLLFLAHYEWKTAYKLWRRGSEAEHFISIPLWIPEAIFLVGLCLLALHVLVRFLRLCACGMAEDDQLSI